MSDLQHRIQNFFLDCPLDILRSWDEELWQASAREPFAFVSRCRFQELALSEQLRHLNDGLSIAVYTQSDYGIKSIIDPLTKLLGEDRRMIRVALRLDDLDGSS